MGRFSLSVPLPLLRVVFSPIGVYKTYESSSSLVKKTESEADYLSRQYFDDGTIKGRIGDREGHIGFSVKTSRLRHQLEKVCTLPDSPTSSFPVSLTTETTNRRIKNFLFLQKTNSIIPSKQSRDSMVGSQFEIKQ